MTIGTLSSDAKAKLRKTIENGLATQQQIADLKDSLRDQVKAVAEDLNIPAKSINGAIKAAMKSNIEEQKDAVDEVEEILVLVGRR